MPFATVRPGTLMLSGAVCLTLPSFTGAQPTADADDEIVIVTGEIVPVPRRRIGTAVSVVGREEIELRGYQSLGDLMRTQPAIGVSNSGGPGKATTVRIRGEESYRTLLMIDGIKALDASAPQVAPSFDGLLATNDLERVEVLRGPQGFIYGADAGGVVNVLTRTGVGPVGGGIDLELGEFGTRVVDATVSGGTDRGDFFVSVTDLETDGFNARRSDTVLADDDRAENTTLHTKLGFNPGENLRVEFVARDVDAWTMLDGCGFPTVNDCEATTDQLAYKLSAVYEANRLSHRIGYSESQIHRENFASGLRSFLSESTIGRLEYTGSFSPNDTTTLVYGFDLQHEDIAAAGTPDRRDQDGYYVEYQGAFDDRLFVSIGARYDDNEDFGSATSTRASLAYVQDLGAGRSLKYRVSHGTGFRAPSLFEIAYNGSPFAFPPASGVSLVEETSEGYDLGAVYQTDAGLRIELTWFDQSIDHAIEFDLVGFSGYLQEPGESTSDGFEVAARAPVGERFDVIANWTDNDARASDGNRRARRPGTLANLGVAFRSVNDAFRLLANYRISRDRVDEVFGRGIVPLGDYVVLDVAAAYRVGDTVEVFARLENALDEDYVEITDFNTAGRSLYGGVRLRLR